MAKDNSGKIIPRDLEDPSLFRLNTELDLLRKQIAAVQGANGPFSFGNQITAPGISIPQTSPPPAGSDEVLTRKSADLLYSPTTIKQSQQAKTWQGGPSLPPLGGGISGGGGGTTITGNAVGFVLTVSGTLGIGSNQAPPFALPSTATIVSVLALVNTAPTGASISIDIYVGGALWLTVTIASGATSGSGVPVSVIGAGQQVRIDLTAVGTTFGGSDLSVLFYF